MTTSRSPEGSSCSDTQSTMNGVVFLISVYATSVEVFLRHSFGCRYLGWQAVVVIPVVMFHLAYSGDNHPGALTLFLTLYIVMGLLHRMSAFLAGWRGEIVHSRYNGYPLLLPRSMRQQQLLFKRWVDPLIVIALGYWILNAGERLLGTYLIFAGLALRFQGWLINQHQSILLLDMRDAAIEQQILVDRFRQDADR